MALLKLGTAFDQENLVLRHIKWNWRVTETGGNHVNHDDNGLGISIASDSGASHLK